MISEYIIDNPKANFKNDLIDINNLPKVSFIIPTFNNEDTIDNCLKSICYQNYPDFEIIIIDAYSNDNTTNIAKKYPTKIYLDKGNYGSACQLGVEKSTGQILAFFDSDIIIPYNKWLINSVIYFNYNDKVSTVWPINIAPPNCSIITRSYLNHWKIIIEDRIKKNRGIYGGGNSLILKRCINEIKGIDKNIHWGADFDWAGKLKDKGYQVVFIRDPIYHDTMRTLKQFTKKQFVGANTFVITGFQLMNLTFFDIFYEQIILSLNGMIYGIIKTKDISWSILPIFILIKIISYIYTKIYFIIDDKYAR